jgi:dGTPase
MQVFTGEMGDYHRTRLTHTLEVSGLARTMAQELGVNESLVEALALMHDLGHPPFGHTGEQALNACLQGRGGFNHNQQTLRIVETLERRWLPTPGLNLSRELLAGQMSRVQKTAAPRPLLEVQIVDAADSVAYDTHDADDALFLGLITLDDLLETRLWSEASRRFRERHAAVSADELRRGVVHELIDWQVSEILAATRQRIEDLGIDSVEAVRQAPPLVGPREELTEQKLEFERYLFERVYRHRIICAMRNEVLAQTEALFHSLLAEPDRIPWEYRAATADEPEGGLHRAAADYLASQTDRGFERLARQLEA